MALASQIICSTPQGNAWKTKVQTWNIGYSNGKYLILNVESSNKEKV
jgi:hypothetical protein